MNISWHKWIGVLVGIWFMLPSTAHARPDYCVNVCYPGVSCDTRCWDGPTCGDYGVCGAVCPNFVPVTLWQYRFYTGQGLCPPGACGCPAGTCQGTIQSKRVIEDTCTDERRTQCEESHSNCISCFYGPPSNNNPACDSDW